LLTFSARLALIAAASATATAPATAAEVTFTAWFATLALALIAFALLAFGTRTAVLTAEAALIATLAATTAMAASAATAMPVLMTTTATIVAAWLLATAGWAGRRCSGLAAAEQALQPTDKSAGFFLGGGCRLGGAFLIRLMGARFETTIIAPRLTWLARITRVERAWFTIVTTLAAFAVFTSFVILTTLTFTTLAFSALALAAIATFAIGTEGGPFFPAGLCSRLYRCGGAARDIRFPAHRGALRLLGWENLQFCFFRRFRRCSYGSRAWLDNGCRRGWRGSCNVGWDWDRSGLQSRLVGTWRGHRSFSGERILVFAGGRDDLDRGRLVALVGSGGRSGTGGRVALATGKAGTAGATERAGSGRGRCSRARRSAGICCRCGLRLHRRICRRGRG
jgi:hypothetical protein